MKKRCISITPTLFGTITCDEETMSKSTLIHGRIMIEQLNKTTVSAQASDSYWNKTRI